MPLRHAGDLEVADAAGGQVLADLHRHVAFDDLAVVQVHLHLHVGLADLGHQFVRMVLPVEEEAGDVARVDRLQQQVHALPRGLARGPAQVGDVGGPQLARAPGPRAPARAITCTRGQASASAYCSACAMPARNSASRPGRQARPALARAPSRPAAR